MYTIYRETSTEQKKKKGKEIEICIFEFCSCCVVRFDNKDRLPIDIIVVVADCCVDGLAIIGISVGVIHIAIGRGYASHIQTNCILDPTRELIS
ncbi:hypothetical protein DERP_010091 [Dermatophagoides pteronyssinus]|uniref:Uncharacterized protein n=1 Tax=Dermatophagoides pteronyssinus TaxID=6956 RepID=A0ABQ8JFI5_DERPT|nr:hypothetical protein DERP_010091 [Dermatophagoides pteronyssinus]